jgi:hypothetical protein
MGLAIRHLVAGANPERGGAPAALHLITAHQLDTADTGPPAASISSQLPAPESPDLCNVYHVLIMYAMRIRVLTGHRKGLSGTTYRYAVT